MIVRNLFSNSTVVVLAIIVFFANPNDINAQLPTTPQGVECGNNLGFEDGDLNGWTGYTGVCCPINTAIPGILLGIKRLMIK